MEFTLHYRGDLKANRGAKDKQKLRRHFHSQLSILWDQMPLNEMHRFLDKVPKKGEVSIIKSVNGYDFAPLINEKLNLIAELSIIMLRPEPPGSIITQSGDIDNRLKTLFDSLKVPAESTAIPKGDSPKNDEHPFFCLLEDDNLISSVSVKTDRLLYKCESSLEVELLIHVKTKTTRSSWDNLAF